MKKALATNNPQMIQMQRVMEGSFNNFDGEMVAKSLTDNQNLWDGFVFGRFKYGELIELRDIAEGYLNADTLMILTTKKKLKKLLAVIDTWNADEVGYNHGDRGKFVAEGTAPFHDERELFSNLGSGFDKDQVLIRVWWD